MKTRLKKRTIDWDERFNISTSHREETADFAEKLINGKQWIKNLYSLSSKKAATDMIKAFGVEGTRKRAKRWIKQVCY